MMIQYKVKPITRYIVTRFETTKRTGPSVTERGQFDSYQTAYDVAYAMCKLEHDMAGTGPDDPDFQYPRHRSDEGATPAPNARLDAVGNGSSRTRDERREACDAVMSQKL